MGIESGDEGDQNQPIGHGLLGPSLKATPQTKLVPSSVLTTCKVPVEIKRQNWSSGLSTLLRMGRCIRDSGYERIAKALEFKSGPTELSTKADGRPTKQMDGEFSGTRMVTFSTANGRKTKRMALAPTLI